MRLGVSKRQIYYSTYTCLHLLPYQMAIKIYLKLLNHTSASWIVHGFHTFQSYLRLIRRSTKAEKNLEYLRILSFEEDQNFCLLVPFQQFLAMEHPSTPQYSNSVQGTTGINYIMVNLGFHPSPSTVVLCFIFFFQNHWWDNSHFLPIKNHEKLIAQASICPFGNEEQKCCRSAVLILHANRTECSCCQK